MKGNIQLGVSHTESQMIKCLEAGKSCMFYVFQMATLQVQTVSFPAHLFINKMINLFI